VGAWRDTLLRCAPGKWTGDRGLMALCTLRRAATLSKLQPATVLSRTFLELAPWLTCRWSSDVDSGQQDGTCRGVLVTGHAV